MEYQTFKFSIPPTALLEHFKDEPYVFLLESSLRDPERGRYSFLGFDPFEVVVLDDARSWERLKRNFSQCFSGKEGRRSPFSCGIMGYLGYDLGLSWENIVSRHVRDGRVPPGLFGFYDTVLTIDHKTDSLLICSSGLPERNAFLRKKRARARLKKVAGRLEQLEPFAIAPNFSSDSRQPGILKSNFTAGGYCRAVKKTLDHIRRGDIYQLNVAQRFCFEGKRECDAVSLYKTLSRLSPSSSGGYFDGGDFQIVSSSPELFLRVRGDHVETRPMKGTRPRGKSKAEDAKRRRELANSPKEKAELLMIADLERNDLGRVCRYGSVKVRAMRTLEKYRTVFQATATIAGRLQADKDCFDVLRACFPGGSVTGCPKIRAMRIIDELEPDPRGIYTGAMGYMNFSGDMEFNVLIRTLLARREKIYFHVGSGIVADSVPRREYEETLVKARAMRECVTCRAADRAPEPA